MFHEHNDINFDVWPDTDGDGWRYRFYDSASDTYREGKAKTSERHAICAARLAIDYALKRASADKKPGPVADGLGTAWWDGSAERARRWREENERQAHLIQSRVQAERCAALAIAHAHA